MSRIPRFLPPNSILELTTRTNGGRYYLRPSEHLNAAIHVAIARAVMHHPVALHSFLFLSNHWHALITAPDAAATRGFLRGVNSAVAKAAQRINGVRGTVFQRRAQVIPVLDEGAQIARLRYQLAHGTKELLVPHLHRL